jgi:hypothetical protein
VRFRPLPAAAPPSFRGELEALNLDDAVTIDLEDRS